MGLVVSRSIVKRKCTYVRMYEHVRAADGRYFNYLFMQKVNIATFVLEETCNQTNINKRVYFSAII